MLKLASILKTSQSITVSLMAMLLGILLLGGLPASAAQVPSDAEILHLLNRISFGPTPSDIENVRSIGIDTYVEQQLRPDLLPRSPDLDARLAELGTINAPMASLVETYELPDRVKKSLSEEDRKAFNKKQNDILRELSEAKILRAIMSPAQLQEVMTDFWYNHFNVFAEKGLDKLFVSSYERDAIRPYALGKFRDLLEATAHHPAMLFYLDNWLNTDPSSLAARGRKIGINENYAREVMELHTLGVNGGYEQQDVTVLAHILTGWGLGEGPDALPKTVFYFDPRRHDFADQAFLGYRIPGSGAQEIELVLDMLAQHPSTAHHIAYELAQYFVADEPPTALVDRLAATFRSSGGDTTAMLRALFKSPEFWDPHYAQNKFKPPFRFVVSSFRAGGLVPPGDTGLLQGAIGQMGEPLYRCQTPNGYSATNDQWLNSDALLKRIDLVKKLPNFFKDDNLSQRVQQSLGRTWSVNTMSTVRDVDPKTKTTLLLSSPEFVSY